MPKRTTDFRDGLLEDLCDPHEAAAYLNAALEDSPEMLLIALRDVAEARQMARVADAAGVAREALYRMLRETGNPRYTSFTGILRALGLRFSIEADSAVPNPRAPRELVVDGGGTLTPVGKSDQRDTADERIEVGKVLTHSGPIPRKPVQTELNFSTIWNYGYA